jgi:hypothetical protein
VRNYVICCALALAVGSLLVAVIGIWVLQDDVPGVEQAWEESQTAECDIYEGVAGADAAFDPNYRLC